MTRHILTTLIILILSFTATAQAAPLKRDYHGFILWLDCETHHGALAFYYEIGKDTGDIKRGHRFKADPETPTCQPTSSKTYRGDNVPPNGGTWDIGHLVPANHLDSDPEAFTDSFYLTNTLPQAEKFNRNGGAWYQTEVITECYRDISRLKIWGGVIWGNDTDNDFFTVTHGIATPDYWWKLIYREDKNEYIAWIFPNERSTKAKKINEYLKSIKELEAKVDFLPALGSIRKAKESEKSWPVKKSRGMLKCEGVSTSLG